MSDLPSKYKWLHDVAGLPKIISEGLKLYGVTEKVGPANNPVIMSWSVECSVAYAADSVPWCGLYAAVVVQRADKPFPSGPLWARNWVKFGAPSPDPGLGDVLVFSRGNGGHVGFYVGQDGDCFHVLGGNQGDKVSIVRIEKDRLIAARRPKWKNTQPAGVREYILAPDGAVSKNEA